MGIYVNICLYLIKELLQYSWYKVRWLLVVQRLSDLVRTSHHGGQLDLGAPRPSYRSSSVRLKAATLEESAERNELLPSLAANFTNKLL